MNYTNIIENFIKNFLIFVYEIEKNRKNEQT